MSEKKKKTLSKSAYIRGQQCLKSLYLYKNRYFLRDPIPYDQQLKFRRGHRIGDLAHELFPGGINLSPGHPSRQKKAAEATEKAIAEKAPVIYEAVFMTDHYVAIMDVLVLVGESYHAWEVKSSLKISETYKKDLAFQFFVMSEAGFKPKKAGIIYVNSEYTFKEKIDPEKLFIKQDLTKEIISRQEETKALAPVAFDIMFADSSPKIDVGPHCFSPYPCEFYSHCHKPYLKSPLLKIAGLEIDEKYNLLKSGQDIFSDCTFDSEFLRKQCQCIKTGKDIFDEVLMDELFENVSPESEPAFLHVLSVQKSLPEHEGDAPYMRKPLAAALISDSNETYIELSDSEKPLADLFSFIQKHANQEQIIVLDDENLLPDQLESLCDSDGFELINLHPYFVSGIWCSNRFSPDYSAGTIRNALMSKQPQYYDRLALLLDIDKNKVENKAETIKQYVLDNLRAIQNVFGRLYEELL